jgi:hypothetical protein
MPFAASNIGLPQSAEWIPKAIVLTISSPTGAQMKISTISIERSDRK